MPQTHRESGWTTVAKGEQLPAFYLKDDTGIIRIVPQGAEIQDKEIYNKTCKRNDPLYFGKGPQNEIANSDHQRRFIETAILLHANLYIMGQARERDDIVAAEIAKDKKAPMFLISTRTEKQVSSGLGIVFWVWVVLGLLAAAGGVLIGNLVLNPGNSGDWQPYVIADWRLFVHCCYWAGPGRSITVWSIFVNGSNRAGRRWISN